MIASDEPWVRQPVVSPGAWNRSASIRTQRCSISAEIGYSAWSMKFVWRFSAMIRCASGSIHVVTNVARLRCGSPSIARSSPTSRIASTGAHATVREVGRRRRLGEEAVAVEGSGRGCPVRGSASSCPRCKHRPTARASPGPGYRRIDRRCTPAARRSGLSKACTTPPMTKQTAPRKVPQLATPRSSAVDVAGRRVRREAGQEEQHRPDLVDEHDPPADLVDAHPDAAVTDLEQGQVPRQQEADAAQHVGDPDPGVGLPHREVLARRPRPG